MADSRVEEAMRDHARMVSDRAYREAEWEEAARRLAPGYSFYTYAPGTSRTSTPEQFDGTPASASDRFVAALNGLLTPPGQKWHGLLAAAGRGSPDIDPYLEKKRDALF